MRSVFLGGNSLFKVYDDKTLAALVAEAGVDCVSHTKDEIIADPDGYRDVEFIFSTWGMPQFTREEIEKYLPSLKAVFYGAGTVKYFAEPFIESGVRVFSAWGANAVPVAEFTLAQILLANKGFYLTCRRFKSPNDRKEGNSYADAIMGNYGAKVGIIGAGMIGKLVIKYLQSYKLEVLVYDPFLSFEDAEQLGARKVSLEEMFSTCQVISNHVANVPATVGMLRYEHFSLMGKQATFINTGRGAQVVEADLIRALREEPDRVAVLDVTDPEPPLAGSPLYTMQNVFLTPHIAGSIGDEVSRMGEYMLDEYRRYINEEQCQYEVTKQMLATMA